MKKMLGKKSDGKYCARVAVGVLVFFILGCFIGCFSAFFPRLLERELWLINNL